MRPVRILHTADIHLDAPFAGLPGKTGTLRREDLRQTFRRLVDRSLVEEVDLWLIAGDLFEQTFVLPDTLHFLSRCFQDLGAIPVVIAPGNHDPFVPNSPYRIFPWPGNVHLMASREPQEISFSRLGLVVHGYAFTAPHAPENLLLRCLPAPADGRSHVLIAHASETGRKPAGKEAHAPFEAESLRGCGYCYVALGHYHARNRVWEQSAAGDPEAWYAGTPEGRGFQEEGDRCFLLVTLKGPEARVEPVAVNKRSYRRLEVDCTPFRSREEIVQALRREIGVEQQERLLLQCRLTGEVDPDLAIETDAIEERLRDLVFFVDVVDRTTPATDYAQWKESSTVLARFIRQMEELLERAATAEEKRKIAAAREMGVAALLGREVPIR